MAIQPKTAVGITLAMQTYYIFMMATTDFAQQTYGRASTPQVRWMQSWLAFAITWSYIPTAVYAYLNKDNDDKLRKLLTFCLYISFGDMAAIIFSAPHKMGGTIVDSEHTISTVVNFAVTFLMGSAVASGPSQAPSGESFFKFSSPEKTGLLINMAALIFWFFDCATLSPMSKYMDSFPWRQRIPQHEPLDGTLHRAGYHHDHVWHRLWQLYDRIAILKYNIANNVATELLIRKGPLGTFFTAGAT